jgi:E3 ubiquitin-protein ligase Hakai
MKAVYIMKHTNIDGVTYDCSLSYKSEQRLNLKVPGHHQKTTSSPRQQQQKTNHNHHHHHASPISSTTANNPPGHSHTQQPLSQSYPAPPVAGVTVYNPSFHHPANNNINSNPYSTTTPSSSTSNSASTNSPFVRNPPTTTTSTSSSSPQQAPPAVPQPFPSQRGIYPSPATAHHRQMTEQQQQQQQQQHFAPPPPPPPPPPHHHISPHHGYESIAPLAPSPYDPSFSPHPHHLTTTSPQLHMQALPPHFNMSLVNYQHHSIPAPPPPIPLNTPPQYEYGGNYPPIPYSPQQPHYSSPLSLYGPLSPQAVYERYSNVRPQMFHQSMSMDPVEYHRQQQRNPQVSRNHRSRQRQGVLRTVEDLPSSLSSDNHSHFHGGDEKEFG